MDTGELGKHRLVAAGRRAVPTAPTAVFAALGLGFGRGGGRRGHRVASFLLQCACRRGPQHTGDCFLAAGTGKGALSNFCVLSLHERTTDRAEGGAVQVQGRDKGEQGGIAQGRKHLRRFGGIREGRSYSFENSLLLEQYVLTKLVSWRDYTILVRAYRPQLVLFGALRARFR